MDKIGSSELIINSNGAIYHLNLKPGEIADTIILVGDQDRVPIISKYFESISHIASHREFLSHTGFYNGKNITVLSTGIGTDNIDIVVNELDALVNIDFETRKVKSKLKKLKLIRLGTSGAIQPEIKTGSIIISEISVGFDGLLYFYSGRDKITNNLLEDSFIKHTNWNKYLPTPYFANASESLVNLFSDKFLKGITISAPGFYGPQGRVLRIPLVDPSINSKIESFRYDGNKITNFEMEGSAIYGLSKHLGHDAITICAIIANRVTKEFDNNYKETIKKMIETTLKGLTE